jgi:hypothetical protein
VLINCVPVCDKPVVTDSFIKPIALQRSEAITPFVAAVFMANDELVLVIVHVRRVLISV